MEPLTHPTPNMIAIDGPCGLIDVREYGTSFIYPVLENVAFACFENLGDSIEQLDAREDGRYYKWQ